MVLESWARPISDAVLLFPYLPRSLTTFLAAAISVLVLVAATLVFCIFAVLVRFSTSPKSPLAQTFFYAIGLLSTVLFLPGIGTAFGMPACCHIGLLALSLRCTKSGAQNVLYIDNSASCFGTAHAPLAAVAVLAILGLLYVSLHYKAFVFVHELSANDALAKTSPAFDIAFHAIRTVALLITVLLEEV
ncbi:MAG: hypothetical protein P4M11_11085 [Candidatus Pacebacteria bacterium]|nr:hypothetical protein [Candidatus Paceibacterota bacterium]